MSSKTNHASTDQEVLDYFLLLESGAAGADDAFARAAHALPRTAACDAEDGVVARPLASPHRALARRLATSTAARAFPRFFIGAALAGASVMAQAGIFGCIAGTAADCALASSTLSWDWNGTDFTIFNGGSGYVSEVYFDLASGMSASFLGGTGTVGFSAGAHPAALPAGSGAAFTSDASFDSDAAGPTQYGINAGESATFRILAGSLDSIDTGALAAGVHVRSLTTGDASLVSAPTAVTPVPEPEALAMLLTGLGVIAWGARRRS